MVLQVGRQGVVLSGEEACSAGELGQGAAAPAWERSPVGWVAWVAALEEVPPVAMGRLSPMGHAVLGLVPWAKLQV